MIEVHVLGPSVGESILLRLPDGHWGLVDAYKHGSSLDTLSYIKKLGIDRLKFLCWTHPDDDHSDGLLGVLNSLSGNIDNLWIFDGLDQERLFSILSAGERTRFEPKSGGYWKQLYAAIDYEKSKTRYEHVSTNKLLLQENGVAIQALAPPEEMKDAYNLRISKLLLDGKRKLRQHNNDISVALLVTYGETRIVLGGDVTSQGWASALPRISKTPQPAVLVKASHHGSEGSYLLDFWKTFEHPQPGDMGSEIIVTPYSRGKNKRPSASGIQLLARHGQVHVTGASENFNGALTPGWELVRLVSEPASVGRREGSPGIKLVLNDRCEVLSTEMIK